MVQARGGAGTGQPFKRQGIEQSDSGGLFHAMRGMAVIGADGATIGTLKDMDSAHLLVDRTLQRDICVPFEVVRDVVANQIVLTIPAAEIDQMGWPKPPLL